MGYSSNQQFIAILSSLYALSVRLEFFSARNNIISVSSM